MVQTDVGVVDVPIDDVGDGVADRLLTQLVRRKDDRIEITAFDAKEANDVRFDQRMACARRVDDRGDSQPGAAALPSRAGPRGPRRSTPSRPIRRLPSGDG